MEKTLMIDGRQVRFKSSAAFPLRYKAQFRRDVFQDVCRLRNAGRVDKKGNWTLSNVSAIDLDLFYYLAWTLAKTADPNIPSPMDWLDGFSVFPLGEIMPELMDLVFATLGTDVKSKNP